MTTTAPSPSDRLTRDDIGHAPAGPRRRLPVAAAVAIAMSTGLAATVVLLLVVVAGAGEAVITGAALLGLASGWALLAVLTTRFTSRPQRWAAVPAGIMAATGAALLATTPGAEALTATGWVWPPAALALSVWMIRATRRALPGPARWLLYPVIGALAVTAAGGLAESVVLARTAAQYPMPGTSYDVGGHRLHLDCTGTGSPTVVLQNGLSETSALWSGITAQVARTTRVCAYDRAGPGWSGDVARPQDGLAVAADLHALLSRAGERAPYVLVGHSSGGTLAMTYAARYPAQVAGLVLLDSASPHQFTDQPAFPGTYAVMRRLLPVLPTLSRLGASHLVPPSASTALTPSAAARVRSFATSPRGARNLRDEQSRLLDVFAQAQALTTLGAKPLAVVTSRENADGTAGWTAAQDRMAALSTHTRHWVADTTHVGVLDDAAGSAESLHAIAGVVTAVRDGSSPTPR
jgi:pimeloyl-ACP methyl ester carboxylesterase